MRIGRYRLSAVETGEFALDGGSMFGVVPRVLWEREIPPDDRNRVPLALRALLLEEVDGPERILVDTGMGEKWSTKLADTFAVQHEQHSMARGLAAHGLAPEDITHVLLTHLHFDHAGGATRREGEELVPTFPNARYCVQRKNLEWARQPSDRDRASYRAENFEPLVEHGVLDLLDGPGPWRDGIDLVLSDGHTPAMQLPLIRDAGAALLYCADLIPTAAHIRLPWVMSYDNQPLVTVEEKRKLLLQGADEAWVFFFEHDPVAAGARVRIGDRGPELDARVEL